MARKKSIEELREDVAKVEKKRRELNAQIRAEEAAMKARLDAAIVKSVTEWWLATPEEMRKPYEMLPEYFQEQARIRRQKFGMISESDDRGSKSHDSSAMDEENGTLNGNENQVHEASESGEHDRHVSREVTNE